jgi:membrane protease YdiL (CAAX protease family)
VAAVLAAAAITVFALSGLRAGAAAPGVLAGSLCFAWLLAPGIVLGTRPGTEAFRDWLSVPLRPRGLLAAIIAFAGVAAYSFAGRYLDPRAHAGLTLHSAVMLGVFEAVLLVVVVVKPVPGLGYSFRLGARDLRLAGAAFVGFAVTAIPLGMALGFIHYHWLPFDALAVARRAFGFLFLVALPEELVFRGFIQNVLERRVFPGRFPLALGIAALIFGASHLGHPPVPNWPYGVLATMAGLAYGWVWRRTGKITASALLHAVVDLTWVWAFGGP